VSELIGAKAALRALVESFFPTVDWIRNRTAE
jgi:hypothetical protein